MLHKPSQMLAKCYSIISMRLMTNAMFTHSYCKHKIPTQLLNSKRSEEAIRFTMINSLKNSKNLLEKTKIL